MRKWLAERRRKKHYKQFKKAQVVMQNHFERHHSANHSAEFANPNNAMLIFRCEWCPDMEV